MRLAVFIFTFAALLVLSYVLWGEQVEAMLAGEHAIERMRAQRDWAWAGAVGLMMLDVLLPIPATAVLAAMGIVYGPLLGGTIGFVGSFLAGGLAYGVCRAMGPRASRFLIGRETYERTAGFFQKHGGWAVALSRWMIILPEVVACLAGLTRMPLRSFLIALACGSAPMCFVYAYVGAAGSDRPVLALGVSAAVPVLLWPLAKWVTQRSQASKQANSTSGDPIP